TPRLTTPLLHTLTAPPSPLAGSAPREPCRSARPVHRTPAFARAASAEAPSPRFTSGPPHPPATIAILPGRRRQFIGPGRQPAHRRPPPDSARRAVRTIVTVAQARGALRG